MTDLCAILIIVLFVVVLYVSIQTDAMTVFTRRRYVDWKYYPTSTKLPGKPLPAGPPFVPSMYNIV